jgi:hypothetical protein
MMTVDYVLVSILVDQYNALSKLSLSHISVKKQSLRAWWTGIQAVRR